MADPPLRILHLTSGADAGGLTRYITTLATAMRDRGHQVDVAGEDGAWRWAFDESGVPFHRIPLKGGPLAMLRCTLWLRRRLAERRVDVIHAHYRRATLLGRAGQRLARPAPPMLYTLHLSHIGVSGPRRLLTDFGDHTHAASRDAVAWLESAAGVPAGRITLIPHGIDTSRFAPRTEAERAEARAALGLAAPGPVALYVGRLDDPKNEGWCLDLAARLRDRLPGLVVLLAGEGPHEPLLRRRIADERLEGRVRLLGHVDPLPAYRAADLLLLPSEREGFSLACAEAMAVGLPHLRTRTSGASELTVEGATGRSVPVDREAFLEAATAMLAAGPEALAAMGRRASEHVRRRYRFEDQVDATIALYRRLAAGGRA